MKSFLIAGTCAAVVAFVVAMQGPTTPQPKQQSKPPIPETAKTIVFGGGCFWCIEAIFDDIRGVYEAENGYAGGDTPNPTYREVSGGRTGHAEVVKVFYDPAEVSAEDLLRMFFVAHNPTTLNRQGPDVGTQYRSAIFYSTPEEKELAERIRKEISDEKVWKDPIVTTIELLRNYATAEDYHQDYFARYLTATPQERATMNSPYCAAVVEPKVAEFRKKFADRLKSGRRDPTP